MYREEDIEQIKLNIDNIVDDATFIYKTNYEPTLLEAKESYDIILNYIIKKKRIIYGGYAQNMLIVNKNVKDAIYKDVDTPDIEFYSDEPLQDLIELCDLFKNKKFKYIQGVEGVHEGTYKIFVNFENYCDISYMPKNIFNNLPYITIDKINYVHPFFMLIDIYRVFCDPMTSYWRLNKSFTRSIKLYKYYPIVNTVNTKIEFNVLCPENILSNIRKHIIHNSNYIVIGTYAYNYYLSKINKTKREKINYYEIITDNIRQDGNKIYNILIKLFNKENITVKEYYPFFEIFDKRIEFLHNNNIILKLYNNNDRCIVFNQSTKKKTKFGTVQLTLLYLIANYNYFLINKDKMSSNYLNMYINLIKARDTYLEKNNITVINNSPFKDFIFTCIGKPVHLIRQNKIDSIEKKNKGKLIKFRYEPKEIKGKAPEFKFSNISGNQNINEKYFIIKKK
jgi:hypothetical protein